MLKDIEEEKEAIRLRAEAGVDAVEESLRAAEIASGQITAVSLSQLEEASENPTGDSVETGTVTDWLSPRDLDDVRVDDNGLDLPALETHAAQLAALQAADGATSGSSEASTSAATIAALRRRAQRKIGPRPTSIPMTAVPEEQVQPSETGSYRSVEEAERTEEQSEPPPEE
eukprot:4235779-Amphidinium_carterae.2